MFKIHTALGLLLSKPARFAGLVVACVAFATPLPAELSVNARFKPARAQLGDPVQYVIEIVETRNDERPRPERIGEVNAPATDGLQLMNGRLQKSDRTDIRNTNVTYKSTLSIIFDASAKTAGTYKVSAFSLDYKGQKLAVPPATVVFSERSADAPPPVDELVFLQFELPEAPFVGQSFKASLKLYVEESVSLQEMGSPKFNTDAFRIGEFPEQPSRTREFKNLSYYTVYEWPAKVTALSAGEQDVSYQLEVVAVLPDTNGRQSRPRSVFGPSLFDTITRSQKFMLYSPEQSVDVRPLPEQGKPAGFSGAIGQFQLEVKTEHNAAEVGEPIILKTEITGTGNFDRINPPNLETGDEWKAYDPDQRFEPSDRLGLSGKLYLDYVLVPQQVGQKTLPDLTFSYFDPEKSEYIELSGGRFEIAVAGSGKSPAVAAQTENEISGTKDEPKIEPFFPSKISPLESLLQLDQRKHTGREMAPPLYKNILFAGAHVALAIALGWIGWRERTKYKLGNDANYAWKHDTTKRLKASIAKCDQAADANDIEALLSAAQDAVRAKAELRTRKPLRSATFDEIESALEGKRLTDEGRKNLKDLFEMSDRLKFSPVGSGPQGLDGRQIRSRLDALLTMLS